MNPANFLRDHAKNQPDTIALRFPVSGYSPDNPAWDEISYADLDAKSDAYANGLEQLGIRTGDRTLLLVKPSIDFYCLVFGMMKLGAVPVLLDPGMPKKALLNCIYENKPRNVIAISPAMLIATFIRWPFESVETWVTAGTRWFWGGPTLEDAFQPPDEPYAIKDLEPDDDFAIVFTSGSTGTPKGVQWSQQNFTAQVDSVATMLGMAPGQTQVQCFAAFAIQDICWGQTAVIPEMNLSKPATAAPKNIVAAIEAFEPDRAFASPIVWVNVGRHCVQNGIKLPSLERVFTTGAPIPLYVHRQYQQILSEGTEFWTPYGATEAIPVSHIATGEILGETHEKTSKGKGTCVGHIAPGVTVEIVAITEEAIESLDESVLLPQGDIGEIVVGGPNISAAYKDKPEANRLSKIEVDGQSYHRMGDLGYLDEKGRLWFCGRKSHRLETEDGVVPAVPVEGVFNDHPKVMRTALVGVGPRGAEVPVLCVQMEPGESWSDDVRSELEALVADTDFVGLVQRFLPHSDFPTDARHNSKIRRGDLKAWAEQQCGDLIAKEKAA